MHYSSARCCVCRSRMRSARSLSRPGVRVARSINVRSLSPKTPRMADGELPPRSGRREPHPERQAAFHIGISAESRAAALLIAKGFRILARRWRSPLGEIDIVARRRRLLVFAEGKARPTFEEAAESLNVRQRRRIAAAAEMWLAAKP